MYVCMYEYMYVCMYVRMYVCIFIKLHIITAQSGPVIYLFYATNRFGTLEVMRDAADAEWDC